MKRRFKKFGGDYIGDLGEYVRAYLKANPGVKIYVGCDSEPKSRSATYAIVVAFYNPEIKKGVHYVICKDSIPKPTMKKWKTLSKEEKKKQMSGYIFNRIWAEVEMVAEIGEYLEKELVGYYKSMSPEEAIAAGYGSHQTKLVDLDVDINPDPGWGKHQKVLAEMGLEPGIPPNRSNIVYGAAKSYLEGFGYRVRFKPLSVFASCAADFVSKEI